MTAALQTALDLLDRQRAIDALSPAARHLEQREIDNTAALLRPLARQEERLLERSQALAERVLAAAGDPPDREALHLQHDLAEFLQPQSTTNQE
jgi:hypothetical protein